MGVLNSFSGSSTDTGKNICCSHMPNWFACSVCLIVFVRKSATKSKKSALCCSVGSASPCSNTTHPSSRGVSAQTNCCAGRQTTHRADKLLLIIQCRYLIWLCSHCSGVKLHLEFFQIEPVFGLAGVQVMVEIPSSVAEAVELPVRSQKDGGGSLLIGHTRVSSFPAPRKRQASC